MKIGVIGAGQIGAALIRKYSKAGHAVKMTNASGTDKLENLENETKAIAVSLAEVVNDVEVLVVSIPLREIPKLSESLGQSMSANTVIIDTTNYYPIRDGRISEIENGMPESVWVSNYLSRPVIKVYNSLLAGSLVEAGLPEGAVGRIALPVSGDDEQSKKLVTTLINDSGFDAFDMGNLENSWRQQPGSPIYCTDLTLSQMEKNAMTAIKDLLPERRELALQFILKKNPDHWLQWWKDCIANNRKVYQTDLAS